MQDDSLATYNKFNNMKNAIAHLRVRDKRAIFLLMRTAADELNVDTFFPLQGFTAGEFAVGQVLADNNRKPAAVRATASISTPAAGRKRQSAKATAAPAAETTASVSPRNKRLKRTITGTKKSVW